MRRKGGKGEDEEAEGRGGGRGGRRGGGILGELRVN